METTLKRGPAGWGGSRKVNMEGVCPHSQLVESDIEMSEIDSKPDGTAEIVQQTVTRVHLVDKLNFINFQESTVLVNFKHPKYDRIISLPAKPQPCIEDTLICCWISLNGTTRN